MVVDLVKDHEALKSCYERLRDKGLLTQEEMAKRLWVFRSMRIDIPLDLNKDSGRMGIGIPLA
jgi:hypothetical protein